MSVLTGIYKQAMKPAASTQPPAIEIVGLSKTYRVDGKRIITAVRELDLSIPVGQVFGFLGPNGAGKTTTIKMICGLIIPTTGSVHVNGYDVTRDHSVAMGRIGAVLEGTRNVYWRLSAWENLLYFGRLKGCSGPELKSRAERLLRELDLWGRHTVPVHTFSRGMQQKVAIACALIADPPIVLLDEPTLGLDVQAARTVKEWVRKLAYEQGKTILLTSHQLDMVQEVCQRVAILRNGQLVADKSTQELLSLFREERYEIIVEGCLDHLVGFADFHLRTEDGSTILSGPLTDQTALYKALEKIRDLGLSLHSVRRAEANLEDVFVHLTTGK